MPRADDFVLSLALVLCSIGAAHGASYDFVSSMGWEPRSDFPGGGRHHPITFANATHGFLLTGSTSGSPYMSDFWIYEAQSDTWTDLSNTSAAFPGAARSYGYGVSSTVDCTNTKAYLGFGLGWSGSPLTDFWELDMTELTWTRLADFPGLGRRHPAMNWVVDGTMGVNEIHVGLGDGAGGNYKDWWSYDIPSNTWQQLPDIPGRPRHHPYYFALGGTSYAGLGHSAGLIERDWYRYDITSGTWVVEPEFTSVGWSVSSSDSSSLSSSLPGPVTTEARVAGTQFSVTGSCDSNKTYGFVLSGDGDDHSTISTGELHVFDQDTGAWHPLPPHPGNSRWAPGSFVLQGTSKVYFTGGFDRKQQLLFADLWMIDLDPFLTAMSNLTDFSSSETFNETIDEKSTDNDTLLDPSSSSSYTSAGAKVLRSLLVGFVFLASLSV
jgi:N-acetylneuraminic acid mutarotase